MNLKVALIADDLTGALDSAAPFALAGLSVVTATRPEGLAAALATGADVVVVNTVSRALRPFEAASRVASVSAQLRAAAPEIVFKKIDSRLKGNVFVEIEAAAEAFGFASITVAPAVPDQQRLTRRGRVVGYGVPLPLPVAPHVPSHAIVKDAETDADLDRLVEATDWSKTLAVGARGLGAAFARRLGSVALRPFTPGRRTLFAIGSHDPITQAQIDRLQGRVPVYNAPLGRSAGDVPDLPAVLHSTGRYAGPNEALSLRFADTVQVIIDRLGPETLVLSGGDTALAVLDVLGIDTVFPQGEAAPGLPWFLIERQDHPSIRCVVKSGGFGGPETLANLLHL